MAPTAPTTKELLLKEAEKLVRTRGFSGFSYADLSERVGIQKASIHHHFPTKEALGGVLIDSYLTRFQEALQTILNCEPRAGQRLTSYREFFIESMQDGMLPFCGALSAEMSILPKSMQERVRFFFELHLKWLERVVRDGIAAGEVRGDVDVPSTVALILSTMEGASLVAWVTRDTGVIESATKQVFSNLGLGHLAAVADNDACRRSLETNEKTVTPQ
jgi:TetR/AcrR family transcriptional regulator, transcriptional repressor for nem operon